MFNFENKKEEKLCIDATSEEGFGLAHLINHSIKNQNAVAKLEYVGDQPHIVLRAKRLICSGEEVLFACGDHSAQSLKDSPWLGQA